MIRLDRWTRLEAAAPLLGAVAAAVLLAGCATTPDTPDPVVDAAVVRGADYAARNCSGCHSIGPAGESVYRAAPAFRNLRTDWSPLAIQLRLSRRGGHPTLNMPARILLPSEAADLAAFIANQRLADPSKRMRLRSATCIGLSWC